MKNKMNSPINNSIEELHRIEKYLRGEVRELLQEIQIIRQSWGYRLQQNINSWFICRILKKIFKIVNKIIFKYRFYDKKNIKAIHRDVDLIIPIFKNLDLVRNLLMSLDYATYPNLKNIYLVEDSGENQYEAVINLINGLEDRRREIFKILINDTNLGFRSSVNKAWDEANSEIVILVNSDVETPANWLDRMLRPFEDESIALATPLATNSGANLTLDLNNKLNWNNFDSELSRVSPSYPDACTAIGYCLAVRKSAVSNEPLFKEDFEHGYGEDTDLHYRVISAGYRSVVVDNLIVWHKSGASYSVFVNSERLREKNAALFHQLWGEQYQKDLLTWNKSNPLQRVRNFSSNITSKKFEVDILFIQLSSNAEIGGIHQLNSIYDEMVRRRFDVATHYLYVDPSEAIDKSRLIFYPEEVNKVSTKKVMFSSIEAYNLIKKYDNLFAAKKINYLQGPDYLFPGNEHQFELFKESITTSNAVIAQSPYLAELAEYVGGSNIHTITLGPKETVFFDSKKNKEKILVISTRKDPDKGLRFALPALENIRNEGWKVIGFGDLADSTLAQYFDEHLGRVNQSRVAELFQTAALILDLSSYEGLGLTALEAGLCGVRSVVSRKGGIESLEDFKDELIFIESPLDLSEITRRILDISIENLEMGREKLVERSRNYSWENSINKMISTLNSI